LTQHINNKELNCGSTALYWALILNTVGRTPCTGDQPVARPLPTHITTQTHNPIVRAGEDSSCLRPRGHCDRQVLRIVTYFKYILTFSLLLRSHPPKKYIRLRLIRICKRWSIIIHVWRWNNFPLYCFHRIHITYSLHKAVESGKTVT
jgi:hypothetical protein